MKTTAVICLAALLLAVPGAWAKKKSSAKPSARSTASRTASAPRAQPVITLDEQARFLAGLPVTGPLEPLTHTAAWKTHAAELDAAWQKMEQRQLGKVRTWGHNAPDPAALYYFFSGPDFLYADLLFPKTSTYILCAIEPLGGVGDLRQLDEARLAASLGALRQSLATMLKFHYFITKDMRVDLERSEIGGVLPILYLFLARTGHTVYDTVPSGNGVRITFSGSFGGTKTLYYSRTDLSNGGGNTAFFNWCRQFRGAGALLKSASYLLHEDSFSQCRNFLLENSSVIVQDDSGIPYRYLAAKPWTTRLFGVYNGTEGMFAKYQQPDLLRAYLGTTTVPLGFAFGYQWNPEKGTLMVATHR